MVTGSGVRQPAGVIGQAPIQRRVWALADTHLGAAVGKSMDRFGDYWRGHPEKIYRNCWQVVAADDLLLLAGDLSWARKREEALPDLAFLASLPGIEVAIKGNHDYWWASGKDLAYSGLHQPPYIVDNGALGIAGTRGWFVPETGSENEAANRKILERERRRLRRSLQAIEPCIEKIAITHYPPHPFLADLEAAGVGTVAYGHLHIGSPTEVEAQAHDGATIEGVRLYCVAADRVDFTPRLLFPQISAND